MVIRRLSYLLDPEPDTGDVRLRTDPETEPGTADVPLDRMAQAITLTYGGLGERRETREQAETREQIESRARTESRAQAATPRGRGLGRVRIGPWGRAAARNRTGAREQTATQDRTATQDAPAARDTTGTLSCTRLPGGGTLLCEARARDASTSLGIEAVYVSAGSVGRAPFWPIDTWRSPAWQERGSDGSVPQPGGHFSNEHLADFARRHAPRVAPFLADVHDLFEDPAGRQILLVEDDEETVACWIALASASLPGDLGVALTFTTRTVHPYHAPQQIVGVEPGAIDDDDPALEHHFRVHAAHEAHLPGDGHDAHGDSGSDGVGVDGPTERSHDGHDAHDGADALARRDVHPRLDTHARHDLHGHQPRRGHTRQDAPPAPPTADPWADLTARLWLAGSKPEHPPLTPGTPAADAFAPQHLARQVLTVVPAAELAELTGTTLRAVLAALTAAARRAEPQTPGFDALVTACQQLARHCPAGVTEPAALALGRARLAAIQQHGSAQRGGHADVLDGLPLTAEARRALRHEFVASAAADLRGRLPGPFAGWAGPLHLILLLLGDEADSVVADAVAWLSQALLHPGKRDRADAVALLEGLDHPGLTRRVLERLSADAGGRNVQALRNFAAAPEGRWLTAHLDEAPATVRLAGTAAHWSAGPDGPQGGALFAKLAGELPDGSLDDPRTLETVCELVWPGGRPDDRDIADISRVVPPRRFVQAQLGLRLADLLTEPVRVDKELLDYAREMLPYRLGLTARQRVTAELLVLAEDLAQRRALVARTVQQITERWHWLSDAGFLDPGSPLWESLVALLATGLARARPSELRDSPVPEFLAVFHADVAREYGTAVLREYEATGPRAVELVGRPDTVAALFSVWGYDREDATDEWRATSSRLLEQVLGRVVPRMVPQRLDDVARYLQRRGERWVRAWEAWVGSLDTHRPAE